MKTVFSDTTAQRVCTELQSHFDAAFALGRVMRGDTAMPDYMNEAHAGQAYYIRVLAQMLLHEAAHWAKLSGYAPSYGSHSVSETWGSYTTFPFNYATGGPGAAEQCV